MKTDTVDSVLCLSQLVSKIAAEILISALKSALYHVLCVDMIRHTAFHGVRRTLFGLQTDLNTLSRALNAHEPTKKSLRKINF